MNNYSFYINSLVIYSQLRETPLLQRISQIAALLDSKYPDFSACVLCYSDICSILFKQHSSSHIGNLTEYLYNLVKQDDNFFSRCCVKGNTTEIDPLVIDTIKSDLNNLCRISMLTGKQLKECLCIVFPTQAENIRTLPDFSTGPCSTTDYDIAVLESYYKKYPTGVFSTALAFNFSKQNGITPIKNPDPVRFDGLKLYEYQQEKAKENTLAFLNGKAYNNVLLYGDRGTGKSSTVKALLNEYASSGLRMISVSKSDLTSLDVLVEKISHVPLKFIVFIDDLTFTENDESFGVLKALLEGSLVKRPENLAVYVTSNRRHLIKETFTAREGDEIHKQDTIDENLSLSDRFGLILTYTHPNKDKFLEIVKQLAEDRNLNIPEKELLEGAERFAILKSGRTPRLAKQYVDFL